MANDNETTQDAPRVADRCQGCGQEDDHPKLHYALPGEVESYHHDCIPFKIMRDLTTYGHWTVNGDGARVWVDGPDIPDSEQNDEIKRIIKIRKLAEGGTRGPALLARIQKGV